MGDDLGDALGLVAHAFQVDDDVHGGHDRAQVAGGRLLRDDQREALFFDFKAKAIDGAVGSKDLMGLVGVECRQRFQRQLELFLDTAAHEQDAIAQFTQFAVEMGPYGGHWFSFGYTLPALTAPVQIPVKIRQRGV